MIAAWLAASAVAVVGFALRPAPPARRNDAGPSATTVRAPRPLRWGARSPRREWRVVVTDPLIMAAWCDALARSVRGGSTIRHAITTVEPPPAASAALEPVRHALDRGASLADALTAALGEHRRLAHLDLVLVVLRACAEHGGAAAEPIDRCAAALRQRAALDAERRSQSAQARMSAAVMTLLPVALLAVLLLTSAPVRGAVVTPAGAAALVLGGACNAAGWAWMRRTISGGGRWR